MKPLPSFNTFSSIQMVSKMMPSDSFSGNGIDVSSLVKKNTEEAPFSNIRDKEWYSDQESVAELEYYCKTHGIIGIGARGKSAKEILARLKTKGVPQGCESEINKLSSKGMLYD